jgi:hypothetical protein
VEKMRELRAVLRQYETVPASRNQREGFYLGHGYGKAVRVRLGFHWPVRSANARAFRRGQLARQEARRTGVALCVTHMADQQGAS